MDYPHVKQNFRTTNTSGTTNTKEFIILHHTGTGYNSASGVINHLTRGDVSCHFVVDTNGDVYSINTIDDILRHCGVSERWLRHNLNTCSIGIEIVGPLPGFTDNQRQSVDHLVRRLMDTCDIAPDHLLRHKDIAPKRKTDVDDSFWNSYYPSFTAYQKSFMDTTPLTTPGYYEAIYQKAFTDPTTAVIKDIPAAVTRLAQNPINIRELIYFVAIAVQVAKGK